MAYKIGRAIKPKAANSYTIADYFTPNTADLFASAMYWLAVNKIAVMVAFNRAGTSICLTLYQDKGKEPLWANSPDEYLTLLEQLNQDCSKAAKEDGLT